MNIMKSVGQKSNTDDVGNEASAGNTGGPASLTVKKSKKRLAVISLAFFIIIVAAILVANNYKLLTNIDNMPSTKSGTKPTSADENARLLKERAQMLEDRAKAIEKAKAEAGSNIKSQEFPST